MHNESSTTTIAPCNTSSSIFTQAEIYSFQLIDLLDNAGCPLNTDEQLVCLLRKQEKLGFSYSQAYSCHKLLSLLQQKFHCPSISSKVVSKCEVFSFPFVEMLQDLVDTAWKNLHFITKDASSRDSSDELWNGEWMSDTFRLTAYNQDTDIMLPIILYLWRHLGLNPSSKSTEDSRDSLD